jgi:hypothetical protein
MRETKRETTDAPQELAKLRAWLRETYAGADLPHPERWRAEVRVRGGGDTVGHRDTYFTTHEEPPRCGLTTECAKRDAGSLTPVLRSPGN